MSELKPCPFCGNNKGIKYVNDLYGRWVFWCPSCHAQTASEDDWNTRPIEDALRNDILLLRSQRAGLEQTVNEQAIEIQQANAEISRLKAERRWIPVSERLPEIDDGYCIEVWAVNMNSLKPMAFRVDYTNFDGFETLIATHWMPIEAPKNLPPPEDEC